MSQELVEMLVVSLMIIGVYTVVRWTVRLMDIILAAGVRKMMWPQVADKPWKEDVKSGKDAM